MAIGAQDALVPTIIPAPQPMGFKNLSVELRQMIWKLCLLPEAHVIRVEAVLTYCDTLKEHGHGCTDSDGKTKRPILHFKPVGNPFAFMLVNREAYAVGLKFLPQCLPTIPCHIIRFYSEVTGIYITNMVDILKSVYVDMVAGEDMDLVTKQWLCPTSKIGERIKTLVVDADAFWADCGSGSWYEHWDEHAWMVTIIKLFPDLERVVCVVDLENPGYGFIDLFYEDEDESDGNEDDGGEGNNGDGEGTTGGENSGDALSTEEEEEATESIEPAMATPAVSSQPRVFKLDPQSIFHFDIDRLEGMASDFFADVEDQKSIVKGGSSIELDFHEGPIGGGEELSNIFELEVLPPNERYRFRLP